MFTKTTIGYYYYYYLLVLISVIVINIILLVFSIIIWTKWCWFELFNVDTLNNLFRYYDVELIIEKINDYFKDNQD